MSTFQKKGIQIITVILAVLVFLYAVTCSMFVVTWHTRYVYLFIQNITLIFIALYMLFSWKLVYVKSWLLLCLFLEMFISMINAYTVGLPEDYLYAAKVTPLMLIPLYFMAAYVGERLKSSFTLLDLLIVGLKTACLIQIIWIPLQYVGYHFFGTDINNVIFVELLGRVENATFWRDLNFYPAGLSWHSGLVAPLLILSVLLFKNLFVRLLAIVDAFLCGSSTAIVGVGLIVFFLLIFGIIKKEITFKKMKTYVAELATWKKVGYVLAFALIVFGAIYFGMFNTIGDRFLYLFDRFIHIENDSGTQIHLNFFSDYFKIVEKSTPMQTIFGYGMGCSGFPFQTLFAHYEQLPAYIVESDMVDIIVSRGIVGFLLSYGFMLYIGIKGFKTDYRYLVLIIALIICSIGYNVHWDYIFIVELVLFVTLKEKVNFFGYLKKEPRNSKVEKYRIGKFALKL